VRLLELADAYRAIASGRPRRAARHRPRDRTSPAARYTRRPKGPRARIRPQGRASIPRDGAPQGRARRLRDGTRHNTAPSPPAISRSRSMGKTGRPAISAMRCSGFQTYGTSGITVASGSATTTIVPLGQRESRRARGALPIFPRHHAPCLRGRDRRSGAALPTRDRGRDRPIPGVLAMPGVGPARLTARTRHEAPLVGTVQRFLGFVPARIRVDPT